MECRLTTDIRQRSRGRFITFEGGEGAGKSTQVSLLRAALHRAGILNPISTREPGGSAGAEDIRRLLVNGELDRWDGITETLLHYAARYDHLVRTVWPALASGKWVVCDRFIDSTFAYQGSGQGVNTAWLHELTTLVIGKFVPDLTIILDVPPKVGLYRVSKRVASLNALSYITPNGNRNERYENMDLSFHFRLYQAFHAIAEAEPERCVIVDATPSIPAVHTAILAVVTDRMDIVLGN